MTILSTFLPFYLSTFLFAITPNNPSVINSTYSASLSDFASDELICNDSINDSKWGTSDELKQLHLTWSTTCFYLGLYGIQTQNTVIVYIDVGTPASGFGDISNAYSFSSNWWWRQNLTFPSDFRPDFQWQIYTMNHPTPSNPPGDPTFYRLDSNTTVTSLEAGVNWAYSGKGSVEGVGKIAIPLTVLFPPAGVIPAGTKIKVFAVLSKGDSGSTPFGPQDTMPDQRNSLGGNYDNFEVDNFLVVTPDSNNNGVLDSNVSVQSNVKFAAHSKNLLATEDSKSVILSWTHRTSLGISGYNIYYSTASDTSGTSANYVKSNNSPISGSNYTITNLTNETTYYIIVKSVDLSEKESDPTNELTVVPHGPTITHMPLTKFSYSGKPITLSASFSDAEGSGLAEIKFYWRPKGYANFSSVSVSTTTTSFTIPASDVSSNGVEYYFYSKNNKGKVQTLPVSAPQSVYSVLVSGSDSQTIESYKDNLIIFPDYDTNTYTSLLVPKDSVDTSALVTIKRNDPGIIYSDGQTPGANSGILDTTPIAVYDLTGQRTDGSKEPIIFKKPATLTLKYFDADLPSGIDESSLRIFYWDGIGWRYRGGAVNTTLNTVSTAIQHFSRYGIFSAEPSLINLTTTKLNKIIRPTFFPLEGEFCEFDVSNQPSDFEIKIFDVLGGFVRKTNTNIWDGKDESGNTVESGLYIFQLKLSGGTISGTIVVAK